MHILSMHPNVTPSSRDAADYKLVVGLILLASTKITCFVATIVPVELFQDSAGLVGVVRRALLSLARRV
jgi:hypothetical protein